MANLLAIDRTNDDIVRFTGFSSTVLDCFSSPANQPSDVSWDGTNILSSDEGIDHLYKHDGFSSSLLDCFTAPASNCVGCAWDGTNLLSADGVLTFLYKHSGFSSTVSDSFTTTYVAPSGIDWDHTGGNLLNSSFNANKAYKYSGFTTTIADSFATPGSFPFGIGWDGTNALLGSPAPNKIFQMSGFSSSVDDSFTPSFQPGGLGWDELPAAGSSSSSTVSSSSSISTTSTSSTSASSSSVSQTSSSSSSSSWTGTSSSSSSTSISQTSTSTSSSSSSIYPLTYDEFNDGATNPVWFFEDQSPSQDGSHDEPAGGAGIQEITAGDGRVWGDGAGSYAFTPTWLHQPVSGDFEIYSGLDTSIALDSEEQKAGLMFRVNDLNWVAVYRSFKGPGTGNVLVCLHCINGFTYESGTISLGPFASPRTYGYVRLQRIGQYIYGFGKEYASGSWSQLNPAFLLEASVDGHVAPFAVYHDATQFTAEFDFFRDLSSQSHSYSSSSSSSSTHTSSSSSSSSSMTSSSSSSTLNPVVQPYNSAETELVREIRKNIAFTGEITDPIEIHLWNDKGGLEGVNTIMKEVRITAACSTGVFTGEENVVGQEQVTERWLEVKSNGIQGSYLGPEYFADDAMATYKPIGGIAVMYPGGDDSPIEDNFLEIGMIPPNCARHLFFRWNIPASVDTEYSSYVTIQISYKIYHLNWPFSVTSTSSSASSTSASSSSTSITSSSSSSSSSISSSSSSASSSSSSSSVSSSSTTSSASSSSSSFSFTGTTTSSSQTSTSSSSSSASSSSSSTTSSTSSSSLAPDLLSTDRDSDDVYRHDGFSTSILDCFSTPSVLPCGVDWDGSNVLTADENTTKIYEHDGFSVTVNDSISSPLGDQRGVVWYNSNLHTSTASFPGFIYEHTGFSTTIGDSFSSPGTGPRGIGFKGSNLISVDINTQWVYEHSGFSSSILDSVSTSDTLPQGCLWDGTDLWTAGFTNDRIYQHSGFTNTISDSFSSPSTYMQMIGSTHT